jgi:hypothetical protein
MTANAITEKWTDSAYTRTPMVRDTPGFLATAKPRELAHLRTFTLCKKARGEQTGDMVYFIAL